MKTRLLIFMALCCAGLAACKKDSADKPGSENTLSVTINGKVYTSSSSDFIMFIDTITARSQNGTLNLAYDISGPMPGGQQVGIYVNTVDGQLAPGDYTNISDGDNTMFWSDALNATAYYVSVPDYTTTVHITRADNDFLEGTFNGKLVNNADDTKTLELISGQFKINMHSPYIVRQRID
ncbi:hypothetical protein GA0116948_106129 [Chitinophaga costaii]|uniref:Uncharacterized protein n=1 Tax=Chitinophaga costaii TaxID=1335309 RepID=A0A1C4DUY6_9BACT|nr:hypothetical protein [Chitinophaga costaii]PUZ27810.1 hypothetical protein DCM91_06280 [Chitinophaga costaii]SCC35167.1 hypothetical protein GA0116948_106129 [Chitinophaga costaii]